MAEPADYEAFAADHPRDAQVPLILVEKTSTGFAVKVRGTELLGTVGSWDIALDPDDADLARKYAEPGEEMRGYVVRVNPERQRIDSIYVHTPVHGGDPIEGHLPQRYVLAEQLLEALLRHGLEPIALFGGFDASPYDPELSDTMIVGARLAPTQ